jgi:CheY-like chemotaxis protein
LAKKVYGKPEYVLESPSRAVLLLRKRLSGQLQSQTLGSSTDESLAPILIVQRYAGYAISIQRTARSKRIHSHLVLGGSPLAAVGDSQLVHIPCREPQCNGAPDFLLLDLMFPGGDAVNNLREASNESRFERVPLVVLTNAKLDDEFSSFCDQCGAWRMAEPSDSDEVVQVLIAVLSLWADVSKKSSPP